MPSRHFSNWLKAYAEYTEHSEAPRAFHFWTGVATIAGALRRQVWIDQRYFQWTPNFYIILVGPAGIATKSTTMRNGLELLKEVPGVKMGPQSMTWQGLSIALEEAFTLVPRGEEMLPMSCITCDVSELGTFLKPSDQMMIDFLTDMWDGQLTKWEHKIKTAKGAMVENPWLNIIGCTTPSWLKKNVPEEMIGGGLVSRVIFVYGDTKRHYVSYPAEVIDDEIFRTAKEMLIEDLQQIGGLVGEYVLSADAIEWGTRWYEQHWQNRPEHMASDRFEGYIGRKQTHMHKLAIVLAAASSDRLRIERKHLEMANDMLAGIEKDMVKVFELIGASAESQKMDAVLNFVRIYKRIDKRALWRLCMRVMSNKEFSEASTAAVDAGLLTITSTQDGIFYTLKKEIKND